MSRAGNKKGVKTQRWEKQKKHGRKNQKKWLTNGGGGCIIFLVSSASVLRSKPNSGDLHSGSAVDSDSTCGSSILSSPTRKPQSQLAAVFSGHSAVGSAPRSGRGGRGFKSRCSDLKKQVHIRVLAFLFSRARDLNSSRADRRQRRKQGGEAGAALQFFKALSGAAEKLASATRRRRSRASNQPSGLLLSPRVPIFRNVNSW